MSTVPIKGKSWHKRSTTWSVAVFILTGIGMIYAEENMTGGIHQIVQAINILSGGTSLLGVRRAQG